MANHPNRTKVLTTAYTTGYLWRAYRSEPGQHGSACKITRSKDAPAAIPPIQAQDDLAYSESFFGDWNLIGETTHPLVEYTEMGRREMGVDIEGKILSAEELATSHRFRRAAKHPRKPA